MEQRSLEQKNHELQEHYRSKAKRHQQTMDLYNRLKAQQIASGLEVAAEHEADGAVQAAGISGPSKHSRAGSGGSGGNRGEPRRSKFGAWEQQQYGGGHDRAGLQSARKQCVPYVPKCKTDRDEDSAPQHVPATPSGHRTRLPQPLYGNFATNNMFGADNPRGGSPYRQTASRDQNLHGAYNHGHGGMSAGVKVGRQASGLLARNSATLPRNAGVGGGMR